MFNFFEYKTEEFLNPNLFYLLNSKFRIVIRNWIIPPLYFAQLLHQCFPLGIFAFEV